MVPDFIQYPNQTICKAVQAHSSAFSDVFILLSIPLISNIIIRELYYKTEKTVKKRAKTGEKGAFLNQKRVKNGGRSENFIIFETKECGFGAGEIGEANCGYTRINVDLPTF